MNYVKRVDFYSFMALFYYDKYTIDKLLVSVIIILLGKLNRKNIIMEKEIIKLMALTIVELLSDRTGKETISVEDVINNFKKMVVA